MYLVTKLMVFVLFLSIFNVVYEFFNFFSAFMSYGEVKYTPSKGRKILLGLSLSYILTIIFTGFRVL